MRRIVLALAMTIGLAIGTIAPASALDTTVTLNCSDGTSVKLLVDADTLTGLTQAVQAMIDYPAGLTCTLIQNPLGVSFGAIAVAASDPFVVGGGRYQLLCPPTPDAPAGLPESNEDQGLAPTPAIVASATPHNVKAGSLYQPLGQTETYWVNIAVNYHQKSGNPVGTLNETIPEHQCVPHGHFTSKPFAPSCLSIESIADSFLASFPTVVTQTSQDTFNNFFKFATVQEGDYLRWSFLDNGNPGHQMFKDKLNGTYHDQEPAASACTPTSQSAVLGVNLVNGNITVHP